MARSRTRRPSPVIDEVRPLPLDPFQDPEIQQLTSEIRQQHLEAHRQSVKARAENGRRLLEVKQRLKHGQWHPYLQTQVPYDRKTADRAINLYHYRQSHPERFEQLTVMGLTKAYLLIKLPPAELDALMKGEHFVPLTGAKKPLHLMSKNELISVLFPPEKEDPEPIRALTRGYRSATKALIAQLDRLIDHAPLLTSARDTFLDLYDDLLHTLSRFSLAFALDDS
ncbi:MAG TPA: DUF3102 domain-containing protein [Polyangiaceae bacterium]|nr:DUF3102 domain-containing protein [Polyangiaceae bacterium]